MLMEGGADAWELMIGSEEMAESCVQQVQVGQ